MTGVVERSWAVANILRAAPHHLPLPRSAYIVDGDVEPGDAAALQMRSVPDVAKWATFYGVRPWLVDRRSYVEVRADVTYMLDDWKPITIRFWSSLLHSEVNL